MTNKSVDTLSNKLIDFFQENRDTQCYVTYCIYCHKVPIRGLLAVETKNSFVLWLAKFKISKDLFVNSEYRYTRQSVCEVSVKCQCTTDYIGRYKYISVAISTEYQL